MIELSIRINTNGEDEDAPLFVSLFRPDTGVSTPPVAFVNPLDDKVTADIYWYLETYTDWPTKTDIPTAERIQESLEPWGRSLLERVTATRDAARLWQQFVDAQDDKLLTIDATDPRALRLPWELLADAGGHLFAQGISIRRRLHQATGAPVKPFALPVRILVVVSRPDDSGFIDPRAVSQPLLAALDELGGKVAVEFLYPPTLDALRKRLRSRKLPPVHLVHFDGHGVYDKVQGLGFLLFENDQQKKDLVDANRLGTLLQTTGVPLMVLNACQSGKQEEADPYASVAAWLIRAGVGSVLAMNYSVLVAAARKFVGAFYGGLADGLTVGQAVDEGRMTLLADVQRGTITWRDKDDKPYQAPFNLHDWFLPALYQRAEDPVVFDTDLQLEDTQSPISNLHSPIAPLPPRPRYGFHGRSREMLALERAVHRYPILVLHGFGGLGKTTLAAEAGRWFTQTGRFPGGAAFISFEHGGSLPQLCSWVGQQISGDKDYLLHKDDPVAAVADLLRDQPALIILDNFESVLGKKPLMLPDEVQDVLNAVYQWVGNNQQSTVNNQQSTGYKGPVVLVTTRDTGFNNVRFRAGRGCGYIGLQGLATGDGLALAAEVLGSHNIPRERAPRAALIQLIERLGGHPLSLNLVLPKLAAYTIAELTENFEALLPGFVDGKAQERNESLLVSLEFSLRRLGVETRAALPDLAVFEGGALETRLLQVTEMDEALWQAARVELEQASLLSVESIPGVNTVFLRFHPTLLPYLANQLPPERREALETRFWQVYYGLANFLYTSDTKNPHEARAMAWREMPNLQKGRGWRLRRGRCMRRWILWTVSAVS